MLYNGQDFSTFPDLPPEGGKVGQPAMDLSFVPISGVRAAQETILRKLRTPPGSYDDEAWGCDLRKYLNSALSPADLSAAESDVATAIEEEEYVEAAAVEVLLVGGLLLFDCSITLLDATSFSLAFALGAEGIQEILR